MIYQEAICEMLKCNVMASSTKKSETIRIHTKHSERVSEKRRSEVQSTHHIKMYHCAKTPLGQAKSKGFEGVQCLTAGYTQNFETLV